MSDQPLDLDLKFLPDWLKEPAGKNPYANYEGERAGRPQRHGQGGNRPPGGHRPNNRPDNRPNSRPGGNPRGPSGQNRGPSAPGARPGQGNRPPQAGASRGPRNDFRRPGSDRPGDRPQNRPAPQQRDAAPAAPQPVQPAIPLQIDFIPCVESIGALVQQIKSGHRAYPLYGVGRMFLNKPERHRVRVTSNAPACPLFQVGENGPISLNRTQVEREAFRALRSTYYSEETVEVEAPKGNFAAVARCRISGVLLGPTNHHGYQSALRRLYEARFSRRVDFQEFLRQIEVVNDPAVVEAWKKECSSVTVFRTLQEAEPVEFKSLADVEAHFRATYLEKVVQPSKSVEVDGPASRNVQDRVIREAIRVAWEKERTFPAQLVNLIRPHFTEANLQVWKHRKRILFVSDVRPVRFGPEARSVSEQIASILNIIEASPKCTRAELSNQLLKPHEAQEDFAKLKSSLAADLHWLIQAGHVIEFHDATLDLPLPPKEAAKEEKAPAAEAAPAVVAQQAAPLTTETEDAPVVVEEAPVPAAEESPVVIEKEAPAVIEEPPAATGETENPPA